MIDITKEVNDEAVEEARLLISSMGYVQNNLTVSKNKITIKCNTKMRALDLLEDISNCSNLYNYFGKELEDEVNKRG